MIKTIIAKNVDGNIWRIFAGTCKIKDVTIGEELTKILEKYIEDDKKTM